MRIVWLVNDIQRIGGISNSTRMVIAGQSGEVEHVALSLEHVAPDTGELAGAQTFLLEAKGPFPAWSSDDTVIICPNDVIREATPEGQAWLYQFPVIFMGSGQLSYHLQDRDYFKNRASFDRYRVSHIICLSELDKLTYEQFGIYGTSVLPHPIRQRAQNTYAASANRLAGYVGRVDFRTRGCDRLVDVARAVAASSFGPLVIRTTDPAVSISPDLDKLTEILEEEGLLDSVRFEFGLVDGDDLYSDLAVLVSPSRKESFGLATVEAMSFGVPVLASSYCPGTRDIVEHGIDGVLVDDWSVQSIMTALATIEERRSSMSEAAFAKHQTFQLDPYLRQLEALAAHVLESFDGTNRLSVFPRLAAVEKLQADVHAVRDELKEVRSESKQLRAANSTLTRKVARRDERITELKGRLSETDRLLRRRQPLRLARGVLRRLKRAAGRD